AAGEVVAAGPRSRHRAGDRVMVLGMNAYAELMAAPDLVVYPMPDGLDFATAAALPVQGLTAHHCLTLAGRMAAGARVLVHAAAYSLTPILADRARCAPAIAECAALAAAGELRVIIGARYPLAAAAEAHRAIASRATTGKIVLEP